MARPLIFGNGTLAVGLDKFGFVRDFYFPFGENHVSEKIPPWKIGVFVDGEMSWLDGDSWDVKLRYREKSGVPYPFGRIFAKNAGLGLALEIDDFVDSRSDVFSRNIHVINLKNFERELKVFVYQSFAISEAKDGHDTAQLWPNDSIKQNLFYDYSPKNGDAIIHYKGNRFFMVSGKNATSGGGFDDFTIGGFDDVREGSWRDAEDGILAKNPAERIITDSTIGFTVQLKPFDSNRLRVCVTCGEDIQQTARSMSEFLDNKSRQLQTFNDWRKWISPAVNFSSARVPKDFRETFLRSVLMAKMHIAKSGAVIAALDTAMLKNTSDAYVDCWPRDAANVLQPFLQIGLADDAKNFLDFAKNIITNKGFFWQMYRADGNIGPNSHSFNRGKNGEILLPIQTDETASVLNLCANVLLGELKKNHQTDKIREKYYDDFAKKMADFLCEYISEDGLPLPSFEAWEVKLETSAYTSGLTIHALEKISSVAKKFGDNINSEKWRIAAHKMRKSSEKFWNEEKKYYFRGFYADGSSDDTIDIASFRGAELGKLANLPLAYNTFCERFGITNSQVKSPRFENDDYHGFENPWFIASFWLSESRISSHEFSRNVLNFAKNHIEQSRALSEQIQNGGDQQIDPSPLAWSHGEFLSAVLSFVKSKD